MLNQNYQICQVIIGADVAKKTVMFFNSKTKKAVEIPNNIVNLRKYLKPFKDCLVSLEATGGYEAKLVKTAMSLNMTIYRLNPYRVRSFMRASGQEAKNDAIDAKALADYVAMYKSSLKVYVPLPDNEKRLCKLAKRRDELIAMRTKEKNRLKAPDNKDVLKSITAVLDVFEKQIELAEKEMEKIIESNSVLREKVSVMTDIKGVGITTAINLLALLPEIGTMNRKAIASLAGLAPFAKDSGEKTGYRRTGRGRRDVKKVLFMACLSATRYNQKLKAFYEHLTKNGKKPMLAIIAVARKLLTILNAKIRDDVYLKFYLKQS